MTRRVFSHYQTVPAIEIMTTNADLLQEMYRQARREVESDLDEKGLVPMHGIVTVIYEAMVDVDDG